MNVVNKVDKVHRHRIEFIDFVADISVAQFDKSSQPTAAEVCKIAGIFPYDIGISFVSGTAFKSEGTERPPLYQLHTIRINDVGFVGIHLLYGDGDKVGKFFG